MYSQLHFAVYEIARIVRQTSSKKQKQTKNKLTLVWFKMKEKIYILQSEMI